MSNADLFPDLRLEALLNGETVVVKENRKGGKYVDQVAEWADEAGLKVYCGRANFHTGIRNLSGSILTVRKSMDEMRHCGSIR